MSKGTSELQELLRQAAARAAQEEEARVQQEAALAAQPKPSRTRRARQKAAPPVDPVVAVPAPPVAAPAYEPPPLIDLDAIDDEYATATETDGASGSPSFSPPARVSPAGPPPLPAAAPSRGRGGRGLVAGAVIAGLTVAGAGAGVLLASMGRGPSLRAYIGRADAICGPANAPVTAITKPTSYPELATASGTVVTATRAQVRQLNGLKRPGGAAGTGALAVVTALDATAEAAQRLHDAAGRRDDATTIAGTHALGAAFNDAKAKAAEHGFTACATGMQSGIDTLYAGSSGVIKAAFVAKADTLCRAAAREMDAIPQPRNTSGREIARLLDRVAVVSEKLSADLKALPVPPGDETTVAEMLALGDKVNAKGRELQAAAAAEDGSRFLAIDREMAPLITAVDGKLDAYGLGSCGSNFGEY